MSTNSFCGVPIKYNSAVPEGHLMIQGRRSSGPGTLDPMEDYGVVLRPDGVVISYVVRDGRVIVQS